MGMLSQCLVVRPTNLGRCLSVPENRRGDTVGLMEESVEVAASACVNYASKVRDFQQQSFEFIDEFVLHSVWRLVRLGLRLL